MLNKTKMYKNSHVGQSISLFSELNLSQHFAPPHTSAVCLLSSPSVPKIKAAGKVKAQIYIHYQAERSNVYFFSELPNTDDSDGPLNGTK